MLAAFQRATSRGQPGSYGRNDELLKLAMLRITQARGVCQKNSSGVSNSNETQDGISQVMQVCETFLKDNKLKQSLSPDGEEPDVEDNFDVKFEQGEETTDQKLTRILEDLNRLDQSFEVKLYQVYTRIRTVEEQVLLCHTTANTGLTVVQAISTAIDGIVAQFSTFRERLDQLFVECHEIWNVITWATNYMQEG